MTPVRDPVVAATSADVSAVAGLVAEAFEVLPAAGWLVPEPELRRVALAGQFALLVEHALTVGQVDVLADGTGAAVWLDRTRPVPAPPDYDRRLTAACGGYAHRFQTLDALFEAHHPGEAHHHLALLAVAPDRQGTGRGTLLLRHHHTVLDAAGIPAYLEAAGVRSASLYHREGYRAFADPFALPNGATFYPMWRTPVHRGAPGSHARTRARRPGAAPAPAAPTGVLRRVPALA